MVTRPIPATPETERSETERGRVQREKNRAAIEVLRALRNVDEAGAREQRATWEFLQDALDEDRLSPDRRLFP